MVAMITARCRPPDNFFRWHDSGDLQGVWHLENICEVARRTPDVNHWLPTREYSFVSFYLASGKKIPSNLVVRLSAHMIDAEPVLPAELSEFPTSTVSSLPKSITGVQIVEGKGSIECRAVESRDNRCGPCRACWSADVRNVAYPQH